MSWATCLKTVDSLLNRINVPAWDRGFLSKTPNRRSERRFTRPLNHRFDRSYKWSLHLSSLPLFTRGRTAHIDTFNTAHQNGPGSFDPSFAQPERNGDVQSQTTQHLVAV